jgi:type I restriction enzyme, S subunit
MSAAITNSPPAKGAYPEGGRGFFPPKLRFPEFEGGLVWEMRKIGSMLAETPRPIELEDEADYCLVTVRRRYGGLVSRGILKGKEIKVSTQFLLTRQ